MACSLGPLGFLVRAAGSDHEQIHRTTTTRRTYHLDMSVVRSPTVELWPLFGLAITTPRLELRLPTDGELGAVVEAARGGIHNDDPHPFQNP
jgi:hypothetical protein